MNQIKEELKENIKPYGQRAKDWEDGRKTALEGVYKRLEIITK